MSSTMVTRVAAAYMKQAWDVLPGMRTVRRDLYLPKEMRGDNPNVDSEGTDLAIWTWESGGRLLAVAFQGKSNKPLFFNSFRNDAQRNHIIQEAISNRKSWLDRKVKQQEDRRNFKHTIQVGDIYYTSWGYDQTNVDFYEVVAVGDKSISVRAIAQEVTDSDSGSESVVARPGKYIGPSEKKVPNVNGFSVDGHYASKWDGKPKHQTASGWGH